MAYIPGLSGVANVGGGDGVFKNIVASVANLKTLVAGSGMAFVAGADEIQLATASGAPGILSGSADAIQSSFYKKTVLGFLPSTGTNLSIVGIPNTNVGTLSHPNLLSTSKVTSMRRAQWQSGTGANASAGHQSTDALCWRGNAAGLGGFLFSCRWATTTIVAGQRAFVGLSAAGALAGADPSSFTNILGFGYDSADTHLQIMHNDGAGAATKVDLGATAPVDATTIYDSYIIADPNAASVTFRCVNVDTGAVVANNVVAAADLPADTVFFQTNAWVNNAASAAAAQVVVGRMFLEMTI